jgi:actin related protein 2/3 complex subunit 3
LWTGHDEANLASELLAQATARPHDEHRIALPLNAAKDHQEVSRSTGIADSLLVTKSYRPTIANMPAYHSIFLEEPNQQLIGNFAILPLRTRTRGPAQQLPALPSDISELDVDPSSESYDPLDEVLSLFRANTFFRNFEIKGPADRVLIYGILFVSEALSKIKPNMTRREAEKSVFNVSLDTNFAIPGDAGFPLNQAYETPRDRNEAEVLRQYIMQMRQELAARLLNRVYADPSGQPSKVGPPKRMHI